MSTNWTDPTGDAYRRYTGGPDQSGEPDPGGGPGGDGTDDAPAGQYVAPGTEPMPTSPPPPPSFGYGQPPIPPTYGQAPAYGESPASGPPAWNQTPGVGQPYPSYRPGQPAPGMAYGGYGYPMPSPPYAAGPPAGKASIITLLVLSALLTSMTCLLGIPSLVLSIIALGRATTDGASAKRLSRIGWVVFAVCLVLALVGVVIILAGVADRRGTTNQVFGNA